MEYNRDYYDSRSLERKKSRKKRVKPRFFVFLAILLAVIIVPIALLSGPGEYLVGYGAYVAGGDGFDAIIIRSELSYYSDTYGQVTYKVTEGQNVSAGDSILDFFASDYTSQLLADLQDVRKSIQNYQADSLLGKIIDAELDNYNAQIDTQAALIAGHSMGDSINIAQAELKLNQLLTQRQNYLKNTTVAQADSALTALYTNETNLLGRIDSWRTAYLAPQSGRVSVYFDGLESVLGVNLVDAIDIVYTNALIKGEKPDVTEKGQPLYRLVNPNQWYLLFTAPLSEWSAGVGQEVLINLEGYNGLNATATVRRAAVDEAGTTVLVALEITKDIGSLIGERFTHITVGSTTEGLMVPKEAVKQVDGIYGVYLTDGAFVQIDILTSDPAYYLVAPVQEGALEKGMTIKAK